MFELAIFHAEPFQVAVQAAELVGPSTSSNPSAFQSKISNGPLVHSNSCIEANQEPLE